jgi:hypothetical protein
VAEATPTAQLQQANNTSNTQYSYFTGLPKFPQFIPTLAPLSGLTMTAQHDCLTALVRRSSHRVPS